MTTKLCDKKMTFQDCELTILRSAVDNAEQKIGKRTVNSPEIIKIIKNYSKSELFEQTDNQLNIILHLLCNSDLNIKLIKIFIYDNLR